MLGIFIGFSVKLCGDGDVAVAKQLLNCSQIYIFINQCPSKSMPEEV
jgi:hypothetical protein